MNHVCNGCQSSCVITEKGIQERITLGDRHPAILTAHCGNQYFHQMRFAKAGDFIPTHRHTYDHVYQQISGRCKIVSETEGEFTLQMGDLFDVPAGVAHSITALEDGSTAQCIHIMRWADGTVVPFDYELSPSDVNEITGAM